MYYDWYVGLGFFFCFFFQLIVSTDTLGKPKTRGYKCMNFGANESETEHCKCPSSGHLA